MEIDREKLAGYCGWRVRQAGCYWTSTERTSDLNSVSDKPRRSMSRCVGGLFSLQLDRLAYLRQRLTNPALFTLRNHAARCDGPQHLFTIRGAGPNQAAGHVKRTPMAWWALFRNR